MSCPELSNADLPWHECIVLPATLDPGLSPTQSADFARCKPVQLLSHITDLASRAPS